MILDAVGERKNSFFATGSLLKILNFIFHRDVRLCVLIFALLEVTELCFIKQT